MPASGFASNNIFDMVQSAYALRALYVMTKIGVFEALASGGKSLAELGDRTGANRDVLEDFLVLAVALDFLKLGGGKYSLRKRALPLTRKSGSWLRPYVLVWGGQLDPAFLHLESYVLHGQDPFKLAHGKAIWDYYRDNAGQDKIFVEFMQGVTHQGHMEHVVDELEAGSARSLVDVAGGTGSLASAMASRYEYMDCVACDQPSNGSRARSRMESLGLANCTFAGANIFDSIPASSDLYTIKHVLHDWDDDNACRILSVIATAMRKDSVLMIIEGVLDRDFPANFEHPEYLHTRNLEQRAWTPGRVRDSSDFQSLTSRAGLRITSMKHSDHVADLSYIACRKTDDSMCRP